jgi:transcriptional accessory protein Tex/SPT6
VHPESYPVVERILAKLEQTVDSLLGNSSLLRTLKPADYTDEQFGVPTVTDIIGELDKPGRDPRPEFKTATFKEGVEKISDLVPEMVLEGVVTNVTNFGAFVDIGVHQDGLVHISSLTDRFVKDPREVVKAGDIVRVKVLEVENSHRITRWDAAGVHPPPRPQERLDVAMYAGLTAALDAATQNPDLRAVGANRQRRQLYQRQRHR